MPIFLRKKLRLREVRGLEGTSLAGGGAGTGFGPCTLPVCVLPTARPGSGGDRPDPFPSSTRKPRPYGCCSLGPPGASVLLEEGLGVAPWPRVTDAVAPLVRPLGSPITEALPFLMC